MSHGCLILTITPILTPPLPDSTHRLPGPERQTILSALQPTHHRVISASCPLNTKVRRYRIALPTIQMIRLLGTTAA